MPCALRAPVAYVLCFLCTLAAFVPHAPRALVPNMSRDPRVLVSRALRILVTNVPHGLRPSFVTWSHVSLTSYVASFVLYMPSCFMGPLPLRTLTASYLKYSMC